MRAIVLGLGIQSSGFEWDALVELTSEQEKLRHVVYERGQKFRHMREGRSAESDL